MRVLIMLFVFAAFALANPAPLGFEIDKATYDEVVAKYRPTSSFLTDTGGIRIVVGVNKIELDDLVGYNAFFDFDEQYKLVSISLRFEKRKFKELYSSLSKKYKIIKKTASKSGATLVEFEDGNCIIRLETLKHMIAGAYITGLDYISKDEIKRQENYSKEQKQREKERKQRLNENLNTL